jgi:hypothetical protein
MKRLIRVLFVPTLIVSMRFCFSRSWTAPRRLLEACQLTLFSMPYQKALLICYGKKSFRIGVRNVEISRVVGEINYWLMTHPPNSFSVSDHLPKFENNVIYQWNFPKHL